MRPIPFRLSLCAMFAAVGLGTAALAQPARDDDGPMVRITASGGEVDTSGASVTIRGQANSIDAAGALVDIRADVSGPVRAAGAQITFDGTTTGPIRAAGAVVDVRGRIGGEASLAGAIVRFSGQGGGEVHATGANVEIGEDAVIAGGLWAAGAAVTVDGQINGPTRISGAAVAFNGRSGDTIIEADQVVIGATATIAGRLVVRSHNDPLIEEGATISGQIVREDPDSWWQTSGWVWWIAMAIGAAIGTLIAAIVLLLVGRAAFEESLANSAFRPISSGLIGLVALILLPVIAVILMATVAGLSVGFATLLVLPILLVAGHAVVAACIGLWIVERRGGPYGIGRLLLFTLVGAVVLAIVWLIPWAGPIVTFLAILVGLGAYLRALGARLRRPGPVPT